MIKFELPNSTTSTSLVGGFSPNMLVIGGSLSHMLSQIPYVCRIVKQYINHPQFYIILPYMTGISRQITWLVYDIAILTSQEPPVINSNKW